MRYPPAETAEKHTRILEQASRLFRERGFSAVSVSEIMKATGLTHGPFYNHFASKDALMAECLEHESARSLADMAAVQQSPELTSAYLRRYLSPAHRDAPGQGCLMAALAAEIGHENAVQGCFTRHFKRVIETVASCFSWRKKPAGRGEAIRALSAMVGALVLARAVDDEVLSEEILKEVLDGLE